MLRAPSIRDVAQAAGVSTATVSRTLTNPDVVSEITREAVFRAIRETGYVVNQAARNLRRRETGAVAVLLPNIANPFFSRILSGIAEVMSEAGLNVFINDTTPVTRDEHRFPEYASHAHVDGLIVLDGMLRHDALLDRGPPELRPPLVFACEWIEQVARPKVTIDNHAAAAQAIRHLLALGHRRIGHACGPPGNVLSIARLAGARAALAEAGLSLPDAWAFPGDFSLESGAAAARAWHAAADRPTAVFCASDEMALGFIGEAQRRGIKVPDEISVVGFDDLEMASHAVPALTTIHQPRADIGRAAARMLLERMLLAPAERVARPAPHVVLPVTLAVRESTAPPPR
ncbi:LacI family DNA-binding transcriptional regulator [Tropicimonas sp. IMCC6043]|uniref:LacI family DNA-binding transcriptional regulator n=1 Tax=Tropicimonas sp. IMCC6043 TaxID=2510645 RepID=UPI00101E1004|nr:LacI family DNA-binding transcriptional regulator [Tropicimonas sp. IMCC6043]RYH10597.1 LacI family transcriptional regulator [Tropicimonas sp. IMCC6043]